MDRKRRVLIVDDNQKWRDELVENLEGHGYLADSAATGQETLRKLHQAVYHVVVLDIRLLDNEHCNPDEVMDGIRILKELEKQGLSEATKVVMLSAYGTKELMRTAFREYHVADFLSKDDFNNREFLELIDALFEQKVEINLNLKIHWSQESRPEQFILNLYVNNTHVKRGTTLYEQLIVELEDLLCRLFSTADSIIVRPLVPGQSGTGVLLVRPFFSTGGAGHEVIVKFGDFRRIGDEYQSFQRYVQPFLGGARSTSILNLRHTAHLGGIIYSLLGASTDRLIDFGEFYQRSSSAQIKESLDRLFRETCGSWYASRSPLQPVNLTEEYQRYFGYVAEKLEQMVSDQLKGVQGKQHLQFSSLPGARTFPNPVLATVDLSLVRPTYVCTTHGDFNAHNLLVDQAGYVWLIDFQGTGQNHILRDVAMLDSIVRFQLLTANEASLEDRLHMEEVLNKIDRFSHVEQLPAYLPAHGTTLNKAYETVVHLRMIARRLVDQNPSDDMSEYFIALLYHALNTIRFSTLQSVQREHALMSASLLIGKLGQNR